MKKILLILTLLLSCVWSEEDSQWKSYFGVKAGAGMIRLFHQPIPLPMWLNLSVLKETPYS